MFFGINKNQNQCEETQYSNFHLYKTSEIQVHIYKRYNMKPASRTFFYELKKVDVLPLSDNLAKITVTDLQLLARYENKQVTFKNLLMNSLIRGLEKIDPMITVSFTKEENDELFLVIVVASPFLQSIEEKIPLVKARQLSQMEAGLMRLQEIQNKLKIIQEKSVPQKIVGMLDHKKFVSNHPYNEYGDEEYYEEEGDYEFSELLTMNLKETGKYKITISALISATNQYFYLYQNHDYNFYIIPNAYLTLPINSTFIPINITYTTTLNSKQLSLQVYDIYDYPCEVRNLIVTAQKIGL